MSLKNLQAIARQRPWFTAVVFGAFACWWKWSTISFLFPKQVLDRNGFRHPSAIKRRFPKLQLVRPEFTFGNSRFDFYIEFNGRKMFLEVKGVTLEHDGFATFPDAPTERGIKHLTELTRIKSEQMTAEDGTPYECGVLFLIQMKGCKRFGPDDKIHPEFGKALRGAQKAGVEIFAVDCKVTPDSLVADKPVTLVL